MDFRFFQILKSSMVWLSIGAFNACGPNSHAPADNTPSIGANLGTGGKAGDVPSTTQGSFLVRGAFEPATPTLGKNTFFVRFIRADNLDASNPSTVITAQYYRPKGHGAKADAVVTKLEDGRYSLGMDLNKHGPYEVTIHMAQDSVADDFVFQFKI